MFVEGLSFRPQVIEEIGHVRMLTSFFLHLKNFPKSKSEARLVSAGFTGFISASYSLPFKATKNIKLSTFQFKTYHNIIYTCDKLFRAKIGENDKCKAYGIK